jgi:hypothetical protein
VSTRSVWLRIRCSGGSCENMNPPPPQKGGLLPEQLYNNQNLQEIILQRLVYSIYRLKNYSVVDGSFFKRQELPSCGDLYFGLVSVYSALLSGHKHSAYETYGNSDLAVSAEYPVQSLFAAFRTHDTPRPRRLSHSKHNVLTHY